MKPPKLSGEGVPFTRGAEFAMHPHLHGAVLHERQFENTEDAKPGEDPCPMR